MTKKPDELEIVTGSECPHRETIFKIANRIDEAIEGETVGDGLSALGLVVAELMASFFAKDTTRGVESFSEMLRHNTQLIKNKPGRPTH